MPLPNDSEPLGLYIIHSLRKILGCYLLEFPELNYKDSESIDILSYRIINFFRAFEKVNLKKDNALDLFNTTINTMYGDYNRALTLKERKNDRATQLELAIEISSFITSQEIITS